MPPAVQASVVMPDLPILDIRSAREWRSWLQKNHASSDGVWLVFHKEHTGVACIDYEDSIRHALCFGWVDSLVKRLDDERFARKFTPRKPSSNWSDINRQRWKELDASGALAAAGRAAAPTDNRYAPRPRVPVLPSYIAKAFKANARAWRTFESLAPTYRRNYVVWIHMAKRPETREKRIRESIALLAAGKKLGLK
jgi:uncharacterized protein YdeI (YjbR/CyaY-like superfamily)